MLEKIKKYQKHPLLRELKDVRVLGLLVFGVIVLLVTWSGLGAIQANYKLQQQIARLEQENQIRELENNNQKLKNQYYDTDQFLELQARRQFGKAAPGETMVLVPKHVAMSKTVDIPDAKSTEESRIKPVKPQYQQNFEAWMDFFFHRNADS